MTEATERRKMTKGELEAMCLAALRKQFTLKGLKSVEVGRSSEKSWTWKVVRFEPPLSAIQTAEADSVVRVLKQTYDLA